MKKSLIALAVIGAFSAQAAMADETTIYGAANMSVDSVNNGATVNGGRGNAVSSNASRIGFKGAEDLGDGLKAVWQIEEAINFASSNGTAATSAAANNTTTATANNMTSRDTYAGLSSSSWGTLIAGIHDTPYKMATRGMDLFADTIADNRSIMGTTGVANGVALGDLRLNNVVAYISPAFSGVTLAVATVTGAEIPQAGGTKGSAFSGAALYGAGPINASLAYQSVTVGSGATAVASTGTLSPFGLGVATLVPNDKATMWKIGGGYAADAYGINAVYEKNSSSGPFLNALNRASWYLSGKYSITGNDTIKAAYTSAGTVNGVAGTDAKQYSFGYDHSLSKRTSIYALYTKLKNGVNGIYSLGNTDANSSTGSSNGGVGAAPSAFSVGMKHMF